MIIAVSNPSKQYTHQTVAALSKCTAYEVFFLTSFWFMPQTILWHKLINKIPIIRRQVSKKSSAVVNDKVVVMHWTGILFSFVGRYIYKGEKRSFVEDKIHDRWAARWIKKNRPDIVIGYEKSCLRSFKVLKSNGGVTLLDLSQVHPAFIRQLRVQYEFFKLITGNTELFDEVYQRKMNEYNIADHIITLSDFAKRTLIDNGIVEEKISQTTLGYNPSLFKQKKTYNVDSRSPLQLVFCGAVIPRKGIHLLLDLMVSNFSDKDITLDIIGPMGVGLTLDDYLRGNKKISYYPFMHHEELVNKLHECDVFVFPSYLDSWAMVVIEAMACGLPVIVTENTGAKDAVLSDAGFVIPVNDKEALQEKILYYYNNRAYVETMGKSAAAIAMSYTWNKYELQLQNVITKITTPEVV